MIKYIVNILFLGIMASPLLAATPSSPDARVYIVSPTDGATVTNPVAVIFGLKGMKVVPAGIEMPNTGHHHLLIDVAALPPANKPIPTDAQHMHFGKGQTKATLSLKPGKHTLQLLFGDAHHMQHNPPVASEKITIMVK